MNRTSRKTQESLPQDRKGADMLNDIILAHRKGKLTPRQYYKDNKGRVRIDYDEAYKKLHGASGL